mgnify:CR=1 FL=1
MALIKFDGENHSTADTWTVAVYEKGLHYGGPEEGGWYYDSRQLVALTTADSDEAATALMLELEKGEFADRGRPLHSVNFGRGDDVAYALYVKAPGSEIIHQSPTETPHYE